MEGSENSQPQEIPGTTNPFLKSNFMSTSYSEIADTTVQNYEKMDVGDDMLEDEEERNRPDSLYFTVDDNNMKHYIAEDLEYKIKISSPASSSAQATQQSFSNIPKQVSNSLPPQLDSNVLSDIEIEAQYLAANVDNLTENLQNLLHSISAITSDNVEVYKSSVIKLTDTIDSNIKQMYSLIAKSEEIFKLNKAEQLSVRIKEIRRLVDMFEATI
ncbi:hypothetical protein PVAND_010672 [Polypedilum vanderplanki]|uniref:BLOC-1-related complex subunit 6 C-terminal helix domain-containing protein n=1 Tax=Polypedilum vanderplanki TaxID=319348 RepID=A0A9J6CGB4_POLVA|nr:hypothetical protein PVAND_010672 [Polypedilum vanderplanki]